jgi:small-conductance mechanosensitive channel
VDGSAYIIPNQNLVSQNLVNLSARNTRGIKVAVNIKYGIDHEKLAKLIAKLKEELAAMPLVSPPVEVNIETFDKETFQMIVAYQLPHPLPDNVTLLALKRDVNMKVFEIVSADATMGTPIGTS